MNSLADRAIHWEEDHLVLLDQRKLPTEIDFIVCNTCKDVVNAIKNMVVRGAPAIGVTAAYGVVLAARSAFKKSNTNWKESIENDLKQLELARPTAVNLVWSIQNMRQVLQNVSTNDPESTLLQAAKNIHQQDIKTNKTLGELGATLINENSSVLTHCNAGALATGGYGTALGVIRSAFSQNKIDSVYADETRPWFQGARLTAWELMQDKIPVTLICDSAAASLMRDKKISWIIVGADRVASNGDVANKIGTYALAIMAKQHNVEFMVAAPTSTIDLNSKSGADIEIEERESSEIVAVKDHSLAPENVQVWNPVFDITPAEMISALVTEKGVVLAPDKAKIAELFD